MKKFCIIAFSLIMLLQVYDVYSTKTIIDAGGYEANPSVAFFIQYMGVMPGLLTVKVISVALLIIMYMQAIKKKLSNVGNLMVVFGSIFIICYYSFFMYTINHQMLISIN